MWLIARSAPQILPAQPVADVFSGESSQPANFRRGRTGAVGSFLYDSEDRDVYIAGSV